MHEVIYTLCILSVSSYKLYQWETWLVPVSLMIAMFSFYLNLENKERGNI